jgi:nucleotide-binding universal stress UspA family protein
MAATPTALFKRILVPTDGAEAGDIAIAVARRLTWRGSAELVLLRVESSHAPDDAARADTSSLVARTDDLRDDGITAHYRITFGAPADAIADTATLEDADLIVLAHHQRRLLEGLRHPSVTARLFSRAATPLLIWPEQLPADAAADLLAPPSAVVLVPLDGSAEAEAALPLAVRLARSYDRVLLLARVVAPPPLAGAASPYYVPVDSSVRDEHESREYLSATRHRLAADTGLTVQSLLLDGEPADALAAATRAHEGSLLVMTTHGRTGLGRLFLGSVAARLLDRAPVPLLVIPPLLVARADAPEIAQETAPTPLKQTAPLGPLPAKA